MTAHSVHSEEYIGDHRYGWWNRDYIRLLLERINYSAVRSIADLGAGAGHWSAILLQESEHPCLLTCVDFEIHWLGEVQKKLEQEQGGHKIETVLADVHDLPMQDSSFDLVTCQTLLMHCKDPARVVKEMLRVTKPGGYILVIEPTNILNRMQFFDAVMHLSAKEQAMLYQVWACYHAGLRKMTGAHHDIAPLVPELFRVAGCDCIQAYQNDKLFLGMDSSENFSSMAAEYEKASFVEYALAGGASHSDIEQSRKIFKAFKSASMESNALRATPVGSFIFIGRKPLK